MSEGKKYGHSVFIDSIRDGVFCEIAEMLEYYGVRSFEIETHAVGARTVGVVSLPADAEAEASLLVLMHEGATMRTYR